uniref:E3 ubiquitin-protein ligase TRIM33 n=1 Tax=Lygus hesperus TaxID=30085 RepID=A0A0A9VZ84_LYGHE
MYSGTGRLAKLDTVACSPQTGSIVLRLLLCCAVHCCCWCCTVMHVSRFLRSHFRHYLLRFRLWAVPTILYYCSIATADPTPLLHHGIGAHSVLVPPLHLQHLPPHFALSRCTLYRATAPCSNPTSNLVLHSARRYPIPGTCSYIGTTSSGTRSSLLGCLYCTSVSPIAATTATVSTFDRCTHSYCSANLGISNPHCVAIYCSSHGIAGYCTGIPSMSSYHPPPLVCVSAAFYHLPHSCRMSPVSRSVCVGTVARLSLATTVRVPGCVSTARPSGIVGIASSIALRTHFLFVSIVVIRCSVYCSHYCLKLFLLFLLPYHQLLLLYLELLDFVVVGVSPDGVGVVS